MILRTKVGAKSVQSRCKVGGGAISERRKSERKAEEERKKSEGIPKVIVLFFDLFGRFKNLE